MFCYAKWNTKQKLRQKHALKILLSIAQLPRATFYYHLKRMNSADKYKAVKAEITAIYHENKGRYGYRRITTELHKRNFLLNHKTVQRLMKELGLVCRVRMNLSMVTTMLDEAFAKIPDGANLILHSDQGWQYQHKQYQRMLQKKGIQQSMSRKGNCLDNAVIENFFGLLKSELLYLQKFESIEQFKQELVEYLDYYNNRRIKAKLKGLPPAIHRQQALSAA